MASTITKAQFDAGLRRLERAGAHAGKADAKAMLKDDPETAVKYDPVYMKESMGFQEVATLGDMGAALSDRIDNMRNLAEGRGVRFAEEVIFYPYGFTGSRRMEPWDVVEHYAKVAYVDAYDKTIRASGLVPEYLRDD
jgi:hypothetical protein